MNAKAVFEKIINSLSAFATHRMTLATGLLFSIDSLTFGSWVTHIPDVKIQLGLNDAELGLALFGLPLGMVLMNPFTAKLLHRFGLANSVVTSVTITATSIGLPVWMPDKWSLFGALFFNGLSVSLLNVCMNTCATNLERAKKINILSTCHGMWSLGGVLGAGTSAALMALGVGARWHMSLLAVAMLLLIAGFVAPALSQIPDETGEDTPPFTWPNGDLLLMIFIGLCICLAEGLAFDWSGVYLREHLGASAQVAALGFAVFSLAMMSLRFMGDVFIPAWGERRVLVASAVVLVMALGVAIFAAHPSVGLLGFFLIGCGVALCTPILYAAASRVPGYAQGAGLASYATFSFLGFSAGPPVIGFVGEHFGLPVGFGLVAVLTLLAIPAARRVNLFLNKPDFPVRN